MFPCLLASFVAVRGPDACARCLGGFPVVPKLRDDEWSLYWDCCQGCGTRERRHWSRGFCGRCYDRHLSAVLRAVAKVSPTKQEKERAWRGVCQGCR